MKNKYVVFIISLSVLLLVAFTCEPSYRMEMPDLTEEKFNTLSLEEKFEVYKKISRYMDIPPYVYEGIGKEGENVIPLILNYIESTDTIESHIIWVLIDVDKYYPLKNTPTEAFLLKKAENKSDPNLGDYEMVLRVIRSDEEEGILLTKGIGSVPDFYTTDEDMVKYVEIIKEKIKRKTGVNETNGIFAIIGYSKGEESVKGIVPIDDKAVDIVFAAKIDWLEIKDRLDFKFLDDNGNKLNNVQIEIPSYFNVTKLKQKEEIERIVAEKELKLALFETPYSNVRASDEEVLVGVYGVIDEADNRCLGGEIDLLTGDLDVREVACLIQ